MLSPIVLTLLIIICLILFLFGCISLIFPRFVDWIKHQLGHYRAGHKRRIEIRKYGIELITLSSLISSLLITASYAKTTAEMLQVNQNQIQLSQDPIIKFISSSIIKGKSGLIKLEIQNTGVSELSKVRIYEDYFVAFRDSSNHVTFSKLGMMNILPSQEFDSLGIRDKKEITLNFQDILKELSTAYLSEDKKGDRTRVLRLKIEVDRNIDQKTFVYYQVYIIGGDNDCLFDIDMRGIEMPAPLISFEELKRLLAPNSH